jgi:hypothetical protein
MPIQLTKKQKDMVRRSSGKNVGKLVQTGPSVGPGAPSWRGPHMEWTRVQGREELAKTFSSKAKDVRRRSRRKVKRKRNRRTERTLEFARSAPPLSTILATGSLAAQQIGNWMNPPKASKRAEAQAQFLEATARGLKGKKTKVRRKKK